MKKSIFILIALCVGFTSCSDDDDDPVETCTEYVKKFESESDALDPTDIEAALTLLEEFIANAPAGCEELIDE